MSRVRLEQNLTRLFACLEFYLYGNDLDPGKLPSPEAIALASGLYLAHSAPEAKFSAICDSNRLLSPQALHDEGIKALDPDCVEMTLGTEKLVFLYAAPFRFPDTGCGFLFRPELENENAAGGAASSFDSGGLVNHCQRPDPNEPVADFLSRHELPLPEHRTYLQKALTHLFTTPQDYILCNDPHLLGPVGLTGGDNRAWTHEVRIPYELHIRTGFLEAVFIPTSRSVEPAILKLLRWCELSGVEIINFDTPRGDDFEALKRECIDYILRKLL